MKIGCYTLCLLWLLPWLGYGQAYKHFSLNAGVSAASADKQAILALWDDYLGSGFTAPARFWAPAELRSYPRGDLLLSEGYVNPSVYQYATEKIVLSIERVDTARYCCKTLFYWKNNDSLASPPTIFCQISTYFSYQRQRWWLLNSLTYTTQAWKAETVGLLTYRMPPAHSFDKQKAALAQQFLLDLFRDFAIKPIPITYYLATTCDEAQHLKGFDYVIGLGNSAICGFYDEVNHIVYAGGQGETYYHELVHAINPYYTKAHPLLLTGYSALRGGHFGHNLAYHKQRVAAYLATHPVDLTNPLVFTSLDEQTNPQYVMGGIFCEWALQQGGLAKLKRLFSYGTSDEDLFTALKVEFNLNRQDLPDFIQRRLKAQ